MYKPYETAYKEDAKAILAGKIPLNVVCHRGANHGCTRAIHIYAAYKGSSDVQVWFGCQRERDEGTWGAYFHGPIMPQKLRVIGMSK